MDQDRLLQHDPRAVDRWLLRVFRKTAAAGPSARRTTTGRACSAGLVEPLFLVALLVQHGAAAAVDEHELRAQDVALALHVDAHRHYRAAAELVVHLALCADDARARVGPEDDGAGHDQRLLEFLADLLPVGGVGKQRLVRLEILLVEDSLRERPSPAGRRGRCDGVLASPAVVPARRSGVRRGGRVGPGRGRPAGAAAESASITRSGVFVRNWLRSSRTVSMFASTSSAPPEMKPTTCTREKGVTSSLAWMGVSIGTSNVEVQHARRQHRAREREASSPKSPCSSWRGH